MTRDGVLDEARAEAFAGSMMQHINSGMLCLMMSIGHQTNLFDIMAGLPPSSSPAISEAAGLNERYVREWLGALVTGGIVVYDPATGLYSLPAEHAAFLTRSAGVNNLAMPTQYVALLANVEDKIVDCFRKGGGVPYSEYGRFHQLMREDSMQVFDATLLDATLPMIPGLLSRLDAGIDVLDVGCGAGHAVNLMAKAFPGSRFRGVDISQEAIGIASGEAQSMGLSNARFEVRDAASLSGPATFDFITTFDAVHDQAHPDRVLRAIYDLLRPGGIYLCCDIAASSHLHENIDRPLAPMLYAISTMHCMTVSLAYDGMGLGTMWGQQKALEMLGEAGFKDVETKTVEGDIFNVYYVGRK